MIKLYMHVKVHRNKQFMRHATSTKSNQRFIYHVSNQLKMFSIAKMQIFLAFTEIYVRIVNAVSSLGSGEKAAFAGFASRSS